MLNHLDENRIIVKNDVQDISGRIKEIDKGYFIVRNLRSRQFEVHWGIPEEGNGMKTHELTLPFEELDQRTLDLTRETSIENARIIMERMEANNEKIEKDKEKQSEDITKEIAKDYFRYCNNHESKEAPDDGAYSTRFI